MDNLYLPSVVENLSFIQLSTDGGQKKHITHNCHPWSGSGSFSNNPMSYVEENLQKVWSQQ